MPSSTNSKTIRSSIDQPLNVAPYIARFVMKIRATRIPSLGPQITWRRRFCGANPTHIPSTIGLWDVSCSNSLRGFHLSVVVHLRKLGQISRTGRRFSEGQNTTSQRILYLILRMLPGTQSSGAQIKMLHCSRLADACNKIDFTCKHTLLDPRPGH